MESKLYHIDGTRLEEMLRDVYKEFGVSVSDEEIQKELKELPIQQIMERYIEATYIRLNNHMFENVFMKVAEPRV